MPDMLGECLTLIAKNVRSILPAGPCTARFDRGLLAVLYNDDAVKSKGMVETARYPASLLYRGPDSV